jgi:hypothetical protein
VTKTPSGEMFVKSSLEKVRLCSNYKNTRGPVTYSNVSIPVLFCLNYIVVMYLGSSAYV